MKKRKNAASSSSTARENATRRNRRFSDLQVLALIPARSGSSLKDKNIRNVAGKPLLVHR